MNKKELKVVKVQEDVDMEVTVALLATKGVNKDIYQDENRSHYACGHWVDLGNDGIMYFGLIDHGLEIYIMLSDFYSHGKWHIEKYHGWKVRATIEATKDLYGSCPNIKVFIGDVFYGSNFLCSRSSLST